MARVLVWGLLGLFVLATLTVAAAAPAGTPLKGGGSNGGGGGCPSSNAIGNFNTSSIVGASIAANGATDAYYFSSFANLNSSGGIPGLIEYCVYTSPLPGTVTAVAVGADGSAFGTVSKSNQGYFGFDRATGDPSNVPLDGTLDVLMGNATWTSTAPANQTILLHINDAQECQALYGGTSTTCFVLPGTAPVSPCGGNPVCKSVSIDEATSTSPLTVPSNTVLHIHYTYTISNAATNSYTMDFLAWSFFGGRTTGVKDYFTCQQMVDPSGTPAAYGYYSNYSGTGLDLRMSHSGNPTCDRPVFTLASHTGAVALHPGQSITFTIDMTTHSHGFTGHGTYCINAGATVVWYQSNDGLYHSYHSPMVDVTVT